MAVDLSSPALHHAWTTLQDPASSIEYVVLAYPPGAFAVAMSRVSSRSNLRAARSEAAAAAVAANSTPPVALDLVGCGGLTANSISRYSSTSRSTKRSTTSSEGLEYGLSLATVRELLPSSEVRFILLRLQQRFLLVHYLSGELSTLRRARALVHGRSLAAHMVRLDNTVVIADPSELNAELLHDQLELPLPSLASKSPSLNVEAGSSFDGTGSAAPRRQFSAGESSARERASAGSPTHSDVSSYVSTSIKESTDTATTRASTVTSIDTVPSIKDAGTPWIPEPRSRQMSEEGGDGSFSGSGSASFTIGSTSSLSSTPP